MKKYTNLQTNVVCEKGGAVTLSLSNSNSTQLADHPCRKMWIAAANADDVKFSLTAAVGAANFAYLPQLSKADGTVCGDRYLELPVSNTNLVHVLGENGDVVYYIWLS